MTTILQTRGASLTSLNMTNCNNISDITFLQIASHCNTYNLKKLEFSCLNTITPEGYRHLATEPLQCITSLNLDQMEHLDSDSLAGLLSKFSGHLRLLSITECNVPPTLQLQKAIAACHLLEDFTLDGGHGHTNAPARILNELARHNPRLQEVTVRCRDAIPNEYIVQLITGCKDIRVIDLLDQVEYDRKLRRTYPHIELR
eukprot:TRINITY_DN5826_c1_g1_i1.p1 TRINITY_DN5826_c1_g1~~TRINITY_DN5826_c1_g1_i1.p1  ORF type:complete len:201 (-),score=21.04 TRINITY_DN5826_c1_g1_i1:11-613(-)